MQSTPVSLSHAPIGLLLLPLLFTATMFPFAFFSVRVQFSSVERVNYYSTRLLKEEPDAAPAANALATAVPEEWPTRGELRVRTAGHWHGLLARFRPDTVGSSPPPPPTWMIVAVHTASITSTLLCLLTAV